MKNESNTGETVRSSVAKIRNSLTAILVVSESLKIEYDATGLVAEAGTLKDHAIRIEAALTTLHNLTAHILGAGEKTPIMQSLDDLQRTGRTELPDLVEGE